MQRVKFLELRDRATFIPAVAVDCSLMGRAHDDYLLRRAGYGAKRCILLTRLDASRSPACYDPYDWGDRTFAVAHHWIEQHWDDVEDGDVIDVEYIACETPAKKKSERYDKVDL